MTLREARRLKAGAKRVARVEKATYNATGYVYDPRNRDQPFYRSAPKVRPGQEVVFAEVVPSVRYRPLTGEDQILVCDLVNEYGDRDRVALWPDEVERAR